LNGIFFFFFWESWENSFKTVPILWNSNVLSIGQRGRRGRDRMVVGCTDRKNTWIYKLVHMTRFCNVVAFLQKCISVQLGLCNENVVNESNALWVPTFVIVSIGNKCVCVGGITYPVVNICPLTWITIYIYIHYWNLLYLHNVIST
jgi:hypothetical protein